MENHLNEVEVSRLQACPKGKHELKELWAQAKRWPMYCTIFSDVTKLITFKFAYFDHWGSALTLLTHRYHKNRGLWCCWRAVCDWPPRS
jgi:hypothetical protein